MRSDERSIQIERLARALAASAGIVWDHLDHYPGYLRGIWRAEAARLIGGMGAARPLA